MDVARIDASRWTITIRGFNGRYASKLLVQVDGRSVYTPWYSGVFWDVQNVVLEDVERIEVIRGPGETIWGANAVNGVINILYRWKRKLDEESDWSFQVYYDHVIRHDQLVAYNTLDLDFQYRLPIGSRHDVIWECAYRSTDMAINPAAFDIAYHPPQRNDNLFSYFVQDQITLRDDRLYLVVGSKFEHNDYTGFEYQPNVRLLWTPTSRHCIWASVARAVRTPSYADKGIEMLLPSDTILPGNIPVFPVIRGNKSVQSEDVLAYEAGIRVQPTKKFY